MTTDTESGEVQVYELGYLLLPSIAEEAVGSVVDKIRNLITQAGGKEIDGEEPFLTELAYAMTKTVGASRYVVNDAYMGWLKFEAEAGKVSALKEEVTRLEEVLRALLIKAPRESDFTFAKARAALAEKAAEKKALREEVATPAQAPVVE